MAKHKGVEQCYPHLFYRFVNMDIFAEIIAFDEELAEVAQMLDEVAATYYAHPPDPNHVLPPQNHVQDPLPHFVTILKVS